MPSAIPCSLSLFLSLAFSLLFSQAGSKMFHLNASTLKFPQFPPRNLCSLITLTVCSLVFAATESRILLAVPADTHPRTPFISFCTVWLWTLCTTRSSMALSLYKLWSKPWKFTKFLGLHGLPPSPQPLERVSYQQQSKNNRKSLFK